MLFYLLFAVLTGFARGSLLLALGLAGMLVSLIVPPTPRKKIASFVFVLSLLSLRIVYIVNDITSFHLMFALLAPLMYAAVGVESVETLKTFAAGLFAFTIVSTISSGSYVPTVIISAPALLGLLVLYGVKARVGGNKEWTEKA